MSEHKPALSPEEWASSGGGIIGVPQSPNYELRFMVNDGADWRFATRHQCAALALRDQPFGFTREDVKALIYASVSLDAPNDAKMESLAARIAALLPPEAP